MKLRSNTQFSQAFKSDNFFSALALEGGARDSGRAWSSRGLLAAARAISAWLSLPANSGPASDDLSQSP